MEVKKLDHKKESDPAERSGKIALVKILKSSSNSQEVFQLKS